MLGVYSISVSFDTTTKVNKLFSKKVTYEYFHVKDLYFDVIAESEEDVKTKPLDENVIKNKLRKQIYVENDLSVTIESFTETERKVKEIFPSLDYLLKYHKYNEVCKLISQQGVTLVDAMK